MIGKLDLLAAFCAAMAALLIARGRQPLGRGERNLLLMLCATTSVLYIFSFLKWRPEDAGVTMAEKYSDFLQVLQPVLWAGFVYTFIQFRQRLQLHNSRKQMRELVESMPIMVQAFDSEGRVLAWNKYAEELTGYSRGEVIGNDKIIGLLFPDESYQQQLRTECQDQGADYSNRLRHIVCHDESERQILWTNISKRFPVTGWANWSIGVDVTEQIVAQRHLERMATHDELTGLANRVLFNDRLERALHNSKRVGCLGAVMLMDLDHFKMVNDCFGHPVGDELLREIADRLRRCVKSTDTVARLGGDEFIILIETLERPEQAALIAERILDQVSAPFQMRRGEIKVRMSMGIVLFPHDDARGDELLKDVDLALYTAKESGRNGYRFYSKALHEQMRWQHEVAETLRNAIEFEQLYMEYQPQIDADTHAVVGFEALVRLSPASGMSLTPDIFIPIAEKMGLMPTLGKWIFRKVCGQMASWKQQNLSVPVAINLSPMQLYQAGLADHLSETLAEFALAPADIEFEITESAMMRDYDCAVSIMNELRQLGFNFALDDFGTGYSSLSHLKKFPISKIKIDKSFILSLEHDPVDATIVRSVVELGHSLNMKVLAEGAETPEQVQWLSAIGCDCLQGFYFSRPLPAEAVLTFSVQRPN